MAKPCISANEHQNDGTFHRYFKALLMHFKRVLIGLELREFDRMCAMPYSRVDKKSFC